jgi:NAD(P)-dependent dehydrogenase (short-subunit alcohol dehydrogenase family)
MGGRLDGKVALITGAASGIGRQIANVFSREGAIVFVADLTFPGAKATVEEITSEGCKGYPLHLDVRSEESWAASVKAVVAAEKRLDILVNNAGISVRMPVEEYPVDTWDEMMAVNVRGPFLGIKHCIPIMKAQRAGNIIVMSSIAGLIGHRHSSIAYIACKGALTMLTKGIAVQYASFGIRANSIHPSTVNTPLTAELFRSPEKRQQRIEEIPMGGMATVEDVAAAALFLASDESRFVTGIALPVDGGCTAA